MAKSSPGRSTAGRTAGPERADARSRSRLSDARAYHPRGRTVREGPKPERASERQPDPPRTKRPDPKPGPKRSPKPGPKPGPKRGPKPDPRRARQKAAPRKPAPPRRPPKLAESRRRLRLATSLALTLFAVLGLRLMELQVTEGQAYAASGLDNRLQTVVLPAARGTIYDRNDAVLAHSVEARYVYADPELVVDPERNAAELQPLLGIPASELAAAMRPQVRDDGTRSRFEWLARGVDIDTAEAITALNLPGIGVKPDERRHVPGNDLAANLVGFTGADMTGLAGLEAHFDHLLRGVDGERTYETGQGGRLAQAIPGGYQAVTPARPGSDLQLTIDADLQYEVQRMLAERMRPAGATFASATVLDTDTFEVLAQASYPGYNAADPLAASEEVWADAATTTVFEPGSAHKPVVFGAALEEGAVAPGDTVPVDPTIRKGDVTFQDTTWHPPGTELTLPQIMGYSSNVGTIRIADMLGSEKLYEYQQAFGLGETTGIGMPAEAGGDLLAPEDWYGSSYGSVPIGHSVSATTLQMATAYAVIANDGTWRRPSLVQEVVAPDGTERPGSEVTAGTGGTRQVVSPDTASELRRIMESVVTMPGATGLDATVDGYRVAGKTGTGKLVEDGEYASGEVASFIGMAPAETPRYVVAVVAHTPEGGGGEVATPVFQDMMSFALNHYRVPPSRSEPPTFEASG